MYIQSTTQQFNTMLHKLIHKISPVKGEIQLLNTIVMSTHGNSHTDITTNK